MRRLRPLLAMLPVALSCSVLGLPLAMAQTEADRAQARDLGQQGYAALDAKDYAKAADLFRRADALYHASTILLGLARAEAKLGKFVESWEHYHRIVLEGAPPGAPQPIRDAIDAAKKEMSDVEGHRAKVTLTVKGPDQPTVTLDGAPMSSAALGVERLVNPGQHVLHATAAGWQDADKTFTVADGAGAQVTLEMQAGAAPPAALPADATATPAPAAPPASDQAPAADTSAAPSSGPWKTLGWVGLGVGGAGIVLGAVTGGLASGKKSTASGSPCASGPCSQGDLSTYQSDRSSYYTMGTISTIGFIAGGVLAAGGAALLLFSPRGESSPAASAWVSPFVGPGSAGVTGHF
jgi:hypothetical protein